MVEVYVPRMESTTSDDVGILEWYVTVGDVVAEGQPLCAIETDKVNVDLPSPEAGTVREILVEEGADVAIGTVVLLLDE